MGIPSDLMNDILDNAVDSVQMGLSHYLDENLETSDKWAILELFHAIELLLKERLYREHPLLIYRNMDRPLGDDAKTVGMQEIFGRFANLGIEIPDEYQEILRDLQRRRNRIEHHRFVPDQSHRPVLGEALKFIDYFLDKHLNEDLEDHISPELFREAKELIRSYEVLIRRAHAAIEAARSRFSPKDQSTLDTGLCGDCGNRTVLVGAGDENICYFCDRAVIVRQCQECCEYLPPDHFIGAGICHHCFTWKLSRD
jgi:hypothetical protein